MISDRHYECLSCRAVLRKHRPDQYNASGKAKIQVELIDMDDKYEEHMTTVLAHESKKQQKGEIGQTRKRKSVTKDTEILDEAPNTVLRKVEGHRLEAKVPHRLSLAGRRFPGEDPRQSQEG